MASIERFSVKQRLLADIGWFGHSVVRFGHVDERWRIAKHRHRFGQLIYTLSGELRCETEQGGWWVPSGGAIWIPRGEQHAATGSGEMASFHLYADGLMPPYCATLHLTTLLAELLDRAARFSHAGAVTDRQARLLATLLDELAIAPADAFPLPLPSDPRLSRLVAKLMASPADKTSTAEWASRIGMSERNMSRQLLRETGMSLGRWRRQLHIVLALRQLRLGDAVQTVALTLGYDNASSFITMFRKITGKSPGRYLVEERSSGYGSD